MIKQFLLVSGFLIALILPYVEAGMFLTRAWEWGEQQIAKYQKPESEIVSVTDSGGNVCQATHDPASGYAITIICSEAVTVNCATGGPSCSGSIAITGIDVGLPFSSGSNQIYGNKFSVNDSYGLHFNGTSPDAVSASPDDWPNAKDCPFDKDKGVNVCK